MRYYQKENVFEAGLDRIRYLFEQFENRVIICFSGGKDSTVVLNLALRVAEERGCLPLEVCFLDQEAEWQAVIDYVRIVMYDHRVKASWLQCSLIISNSTSAAKPWLDCWDEKDPENWMREKEEIAIKENVFGTNRFAEMFGAFLKYRYPEQSACMLSGVRCEESPARTLGLTNAATFQWITWGKKRDGELGHYDFYPIFDWSISDVWKAIHTNKWNYCSIYDSMYAYGIPIQNMRVSNVHHETAVDKLFYLQEIEPETWEKLTQRLQGVKTAGQLGFDDYFYKGELPYMFSGWKEYRDYLTVKLNADERIRKIFQDEFALFDSRMEAGHFDTTPENMYKVQIQAVLSNDYHGTKTKNYWNRHRNQAGRNKRAIKLVKIEEIEEETEGEHG